MSETVKLIIEIPKSALELLNTTGVDWLGAEHILSAVAEGIPLDSVKAEIKQKAWDTQEVDGEHDNYKAVDVSDVFEILDNIRKENGK